MRAGRDTSGRCHLPRAVSRRGSGREAGRLRDRRPSRWAGPPRRTMRWPPRLGIENFDKLREMVAATMQREYDQMARLRIKRELLDVLAEQARLPGAAEPGRCRVRGDLAARRSRSAGRAGSMTRMRGKRRGHPEGRVPDHRRPARAAGAAAFARSAEPANIQVTPGGAQSGAAAGSRALPGAGDAGRRVLPQEPAGDRAAPRPDLRGQGGRLHPRDREGRGPAGCT